MPHLARNFGATSRSELADPKVGVEWRYFLDRFRLSLVETLGLASARASGVAAGLHEMVDNVVEHAGLGDVPVPSSLGTTSAPSVLYPARQRRGGASWTASTSTSRPFERTSKRRRGFPSETHVKRGVRVVHGDKELLEKLGRNDPCPCGSGRRFQALLHEERRA